MIHDYNILCYTVPAPLVILSIPNDQIVGQALLLKCDITTVRGVTSKTDIIWSSDGLELKRTNGINISMVTNNSMLYTDMYLISLLSTADEERAYECTAVITAQSPIMASDTVSLNVTSKYIV